MPREDFGPATEAEGGDGAVLLNSGYAILGKILAGEGVVKFTKALFDGGEIPEGTVLEELTAPIEEVGEGLIAGSKNTGTGEATVFVQASSMKVEKGFFIKGVMLYVENLKDGADVPYSYLPLQDDPVWIRPEGSAVGKLVDFEIINIVSNASVVIAQINPEALARAADLAELAARAVAVAEIPVSIPVSAWKKGESTMPRFALYADMENSEIAEHLYPDVVLDNTSMDIASACGLCPKVQIIEEGKLRFFARKVPQADITGVCRLLSGGEGTGVGSVAVPGVSDADLKAVDDKATEALDAVAKFAYSINSLPTQGGSLIYNGNAQSPSWNGYNPDMLELSGVTTGTDAGTYEAIFTPKGEYHWSDGSQEGRPVLWTIGRAAVSAVPAQSDTLTYTGKVQSPSWKNYDAAQLDISGETSATNAGTHAATFTPKANYQWPDGSTGAKPVNWNINRATISAVPAQSGTLTYTGQAQSPAWSDYDTSKMSIGGTTSATNAGAFSATFTPDENHQWSDGTSAPKSVNWSIGKAAGSLTLSKTTMTLNKAAMSSTFTVTRDGNGTITATSSNTSVATVSVSGTTVTVTGKAFGAVTITVKVAEGSNHKAPADKTCSVTVNVFNSTLNSNTWDAIKAASDADEGKNYWATGDTKTIKINGSVGNFTFSNLSIDAFIIGFNHNSAKEGNHRIHFLIGKIGGKDVALCDSNYDSTSSSTGRFQMNTSNTNVGGWKDSNMRTTILGNSKTPTSPLAGSFMAALPSDLRAVMKTVTKYTDNTGNSSNTAGAVTATTDYLFLLAEFEVFGARSYANQYEQNSQLQYDYFKAGNSRIAYRHTATSSAVWWFCRSPYYTNNSGFRCVSTGGNHLYYSAYRSGGLRLGFAV